MPNIEVVLVHGAFVDGSGWEAVYRLLRADGHRVSIVQNSTTSLSDDVAATEAVLAQVQRRRMLPTRVIQRMQVNAHKGLKYVFQHPGPLTAPLPMRIAVRVPGLQDIMGRVIGVGIRPEHVEGAVDRSPACPRWVKGIACCAGVITAIAVTAIRIKRPAQSLQC